MGDAFDAVTVFFGAAVAGVTLFLPVTFSTVRDSTPYRITNLINSVPRGAAIGVIVAVAVAVIVCTAARPATAWLTALLGAVTQLVNHIAGEQVSSADMLTTQNYIDSVCAGVVLGALGAAVLRRALPAAGLALGGAGFFVFSDLSDLLNIDLDPYAVLETPPRWLIAVLLVLLVFSTMRNWSATVDQPPRPAIELPITPILAALVLALVILAVTEWLTKQFSNAPAIDHAVDIGLAAAATIAAATVAAMLLPGRDGAAVYLAVALTAAADAFGYVPRPGWSVWGMVALTAIGLLAGVRMPSMTLAVTLIAGIAGFAVLTPPDANWLLFTASSAVLALTAGYCCATARPRYAPSGVLALSALYLPSVVTALPDTDKAWHTPEASDYNSTPGRAALAIALGSAVGLAVLYRLRPRGRPRASGSTPDAALADI